MVCLVEEPCGLSGCDGLLLSSIREPCITALSIRAVEGTGRSV